MLAFLQILTLMLVALTMAMAVGHALELPGKMRLDRQTYLAVQHIYYPGFTIGGAVGEAGGIVALVVLVVLTPAGSMAFWLTLLALAGMIGVQAVYWIYTHPANRYWLSDETLGQAGSEFFAVGAANAPAGQAEAADWMRLRDRWEYSHVARAGLATLSLLALAIAIMVTPTPAQ